MVVVPKREVLTIQNQTGTFLSLYDKAGNVIARSACENENSNITVFHDGLIYTSFHFYPEQCFIDYASLVSKFAPSQN